MRCPELGPGPARRKHIAGVYTSDKCRLVAEATFIGSFPANRSMHFSPRLDTRLSLVYYYIIVIFTDF